MSPIPPQPRCKRCGTLLVNTVCPMSTCGWTPTIVYGAPFPQKGCSGCEAGRRQLDAEREVRRRFREWLAQGASHISSTSTAGRAQAFQDALDHCDELERGLLGEGKSDCGMVFAPCGCQVISRADIVGAIDNWENEQTRARLTPKDVLDLAEAIVAALPA